MIKSVRIKVVGKVQHVGFRYYTTIEARKLSIKGFVKNEYDGSVLIEAEGEEINVDLFNIAIEKGPAWARVDSIQIQSIPNQEYEKFSVK